MVRYQYLQVKMNFLCHSKSIILVVSIFCVTIKFSDCFHNDNFVQGNISDCTDFGECSQICENSGCSCLPGFKLQVDKKSCELIEKEWKLVFAGHGKIGCLEMDKHGKLRETSNMDYTNFLITEIEVDARKKLVYWKADDPETNMDAVYRSYLERPDTFEKVVRGGSFHPVQIAFDWITSNMYVAEDLGRIVVCRSDTLDTCGVLIDNLNSTGYMKHLALHPNLALLFWIDATSQSISRAGMDGTSPVQIIKTEQNWIQSIAVDQGNGRIYWIHMSSDLTTIKSSKLDGTDIKETISLSTSLPNLQGLSIFGDTLFLMMTFPKSASGQTIESFNKFSGANRTILWNSSETVFGTTAVLHTASQPILRENPCKNNSVCDHICVLSTSGFGCVCKEGWERAADGITCVSILSGETVNYIILSVLFLICVVIGVGVFVIYKRRNRALL